ncbi:delta-like protein D, partial [Stegodyphus dumicola]|uniref:delta-like protein D n=1 Tax=Stegodyphus dumicola TaxID=202533 RepID=UPI0015AB54EF
GGKLSAVDVKGNWVQNSLELLQFPASVVRLVSKLTLMRSHCEGNYIHHLQTGYLTVESFGIFELDLVSFENRGGREILGGCCSGRHRADGSCQGTCSVYLRICIKHYQATVDPDSPCTFHEFQTPPLTANKSTNPNEEDSGIFNLQDQHRMSFNLGFTWPGEFSLIIEAWRHSDKKGSNKVLVARFIAQRTLQTGLDWTQDKLSTNQSSLEVLYRVYCAENYYGPKCDALCRARDDKFGHYTCRDDGQKVCKAGWTGDYCDKVVCPPGCHHGTCDQPNKCKCRSGWEGEFCDTCIRYPGCMHGTCSQPWQCNCDEGWGGLFCDQDLNYCTNHKPCQNGGTCTNTGQGSYTCSCTEEFMGERCEILQNPCKKNPCQNNGTCENPSAGNYSCKCSPGFFGIRCETSANICTENPCENGGSCIHDPGGFICSCLAGYTGPHCENVEVSSCKDGQCLNGGTCIDLQNGAHCKCPQGLSGKYCEIILTCSSNICKNGGTCTEYSGTVMCDCPSGFSGTFCQNGQSSCSSKPCANGGVCQDTKDGYNCDCKPGFSGKDCTVSNDSCNPQTCLNGALCHVTANGFMCHCPSGYRGNRCQIKEGSILQANWNEQPSVASNVSHRVSEEQEKFQLSGKQVAVIASLCSVFVILIIVLSFCVIFCVLRKRKRQRHAEETQRAKEYDFDLEDEQLQNERNAMHMNNKQCNMPQKIVNALDRVPAKVSNEAPPKVLNSEVNNKKVPDKSLVCTPRTLQKKDILSDSSIGCHFPQDWPPCNSSGIYVIEDHFRASSEQNTGLEMENVLATEV